MTPIVFCALIRAVAQAVQRGGDKLPAAEDAVRGGGRHLAEDPVNGENDSRTEDPSEQRGDNDESKGLDPARHDQHGHPCFEDGSPSISPDQRMRGTGRQAQAPRDQVPVDRADQPGEEDEVVHPGDVHHAAADCLGHGRAEGERGDEVENGSPDHALQRGEHAGGDHGCDRISGIVKAVDKVEGQGHTDDEDGKDEGGFRHWR